MTTINNDLNDSETNQKATNCIDCGNCKNSKVSNEPIKQIESDHVTDIRNHLSPSTVVWDLASGEDLTAEAERHG